MSGEPTYVILNGQLVPREQAVVSVFDYGFLYGCGLFETVRAYRGRPFRLSAHLRRLRRSAEELGWSLAVEEETVSRWVEEVLTANRLTTGDARVRLTVTPGAGPPLADWSCGEGPPTWVVMAAPLPADFDERLARGWRALIYPRARGQQAATAGVKSLSYLENVLARQWARSRGADEALFINSVGRLTEGTVSNLFVVRDGRVVTPPLSEGLLPGVTRAEVLEIAPREGVAIEERPLTPPDLQTCEEAFLTNAVVGLVPLVQVEGRTLPVGEVTQKLRAAYREDVCGQLGNHHPPPTSIQDTGCRIQDTTALPPRYRMQDTG